MAKPFVMWDDVALTSPSGLTATSTVNVAPQGSGGGDRVRVRNATNDGWI